MFKEELALALFSGFGIAAIPAFLIFLDYHKPSNVHTAVLFVFALFGTGAAVVLIPARYLLVLALSIPFLLFVFVAIAKRR